MEVSEEDVKFLKMIRDNIDHLHKMARDRFDKDDVLILDVAPHVYDGARKWFHNAVVKTLDIDPKSGADYICDLADANVIEDEAFDVIFCTEVLEHTNDPFGSVNELHRILRQGGTLLASTPFNFRIHNPLPDNWRFTEHGLRLLFRDFSECLITPLESGRFLMPVQYTVTARK